MVCCSFNSHRNAQQPRQQTLFWLLLLPCLFSGFSTAFGEQQPENNAESAWKETTLDFGELATVSVAISPDGKTLAWGHGRDFETKARLAPISLVDLETGKTTMRLRGHAFPLNSVCFLAGGKRLASGDNEGFMAIWDLESGKEVEAARPHTNTIRCIRGSKDGKRFASAGSGTILLWGDSLESPLHSFVVDRSSSKEVRFSADGRTVAACSGERVTVWDCETGANTAKSDAYDLLRSIDISLDGKSLLAVTGRGNVVVLDYATLKERANIPMKATHDKVSALTGTECLIAGSGGRLEVYDYAAKRQKHLLSKGDQGGHGGMVYELELSPDRTLVAASHKEKAKVWRQVRQSKEKQ
jgi:WD40 repeat protein